MVDGHCLKRTVRIINARGLHARAAARFTELAESYDCEISVSRGGETVSGRSIMGLLMLAASRDAEIEIAATGTDADAALDALCGLVADGFGEEEESGT